MKTICLTLMLIVFRGSGIFLFAQQYPDISVLKQISETDQKSFRSAAFTFHPGIGSNYDLKYHRFNWYVDPAVLYIRGSVTSYFKTLEDDFRQMSFELNTNLTVDSVMYHNHSVAFQHTTSGELSVSLGEVLPSGHLDSVTVYYQGVPDQGTGFGSFMQALHQGEPIIWTLSQPYGTSDWWPCKNTLEDKIDSIDVLVTTPSRYRVGSNGLLVEETAMGSDTRYHWKHRYPIAAYLIAFAVTNYAAYSDWVVTGEDSIEVLNYVYPENLALAKFQTADMLKVMQYYVEQFGPYPFRKEKYGHAQFSWGGGMEHQTMSFMGGFGFELASHELAHSWFGNMITCRSWHEIWLNEGFATYCAGLAYEHYSPDLYWPIWKSNNISYITLAPGGSVYVADTTSVARIFDARLSYSKAAFLLHMLRWIIGDDAFFTAVRNYLDDPLLEYGFAGTEDLKRHLETVSGKDLTGFFNNWYYGEGYPSYTIRCNTINGTQVQVTIYQEQSHPSVDFFELPVPVRFKNDEQDTILVFDHQYSGQAFVVDPGFSVDSVFFDPERWIISKGNAVFLNLPDDAQNSLLIIPNPTNQFLQVVSSSLEIEQLDLYDLSGRHLEVPVMVLFLRRSFQLDLSACRSGTYVLKVTTPTGMISRKVVKSK